MKIKTLTVAPIGRPQTSGALGCYHPLENMWKEQQVTKPGTLRMVLEVHTHDSVLQVVGLNAAVAHQANDEKAVQREEMTTEEGRICQQCNWKSNSPKKGLASM